MIRTCRWLLWLVSWAPLAFATAQDFSEPSLPAVRCLSFSPDGSLLAAAAANQLADGQLVVWDVATFQPRWRHSEPVGFPWLAFSPDGKQLALSRFAPETKLFEASSGNEIGELKGHTNHARCVVYAPGGEQIITGSYDKTIILWDAKTGEAAAKLEGLPELVYAVAVSPDGKLLASANSRASSAQVWDLSNRAVKHVFPQLGSLVPHVTFSPDGELLAVSSWSGGLRLFDTQAFKLSRRIDQIGGVDCAAFSADGRWLAVASRWPGVHVFRADAAADPQLQERIRGLLAKFEDDSYDVREQADRELAEIGPPAQPQLREALRSPSAETRIRSRRLLQRLGSPESAIKLNGHQDAAQAVAFSPDGKLLASGDQTGTIIVWSIGTWEQVAKLTIATGDATGR